MIFDPADSSLDEVAARVYRLLRSGTDDHAVYNELRDRRLLPILAGLVATKGRPPFAPQDTTAGQADRIAETAAYLLGDIAGPQDEETVQVLVGALDHGNDRLKLAAATALGQIGVAAAAGKVLAFAEQMMDQGQIGAVARLTQALAKIGDEDARTRLALFVDRHRGHADKHVQHVVAEAESAIRSIDERLA